MSRSHMNKDRLAATVLRVPAIGSVLLLLTIALFLVVESWPVMIEGGWQHFFVDQGWYPLEQRYGLMPIIVGSIAVATGAIVIAAPLGIASAIFEVFYAPARVARVYQLMIALLAGIPSVVFGLWGLTVLVPLITDYQPPGASLLAAILVVSLMILPTVALTSKAALSGLPASWLRGGAALGLSRQAQITGIAIPAARAGIAGGILLVIARALGETMAVLMVAGNVVAYPSSLFDPVRVLTANIALEMAYATGQHRAGLFVSGLLIMLMVLVLAGLAMRLNRSTQHAW